jgi:tetratricopeptide (TPR) repeat protein
MGYALYRVNRFEEAKRFFFRQLKKDDKSAEAYFYLGRISRASGKIEEAALYCCTALDVDPEDVLARFNLAVNLFALEQRVEALKQYEKVLQVCAFFDNKACKLKALILLYAPSFEL